MQSKRTAEDSGIIHEPIWDQVPVPRFPKLKDEARLRNFDAVVVGGGITGLMTAYYLKQAGVKVCVLERDRVAGGDTASTTAHLTYITDLRLSDLVEGFGENIARLVWRSGELAIDAIEDLVAKHSIECDFQRVPGYLHASLENKYPANEIDSLQKEADLASRLGFQAHYEESVPIVKRPGIRFAHQAKFHPRKFLAAIASLIPGQGSAVYEHSEVTKVESDPLTVQCGSVKIRAKHLAVSTNVPIIGKQNLISAALFQTKIASYSSYVLGAAVPKNKYPQISLWDTTDPYFYLRVDSHPHQDYVVFGGKDHKTGQEKGLSWKYVQLEKVLTSIIPEAEVRYYWSGQLVETHDGLPFIGEISEDQFIGTGYCGNGFTFGTVAALMCTDWVQKRGNPFTEIFSPHRKELHAGGAWNYLKENADFPVCYLEDKLRRFPAFQESALRPGEGKIFILNEKKAACFRDKKGKLQAVDAVCTHMGCLVRFNSAESTWDCPCHGSRFHTDGSVLAGPAEKPLKSLDPSET